MNWIHKILLAITIFVSALLLSSYASMYISPATVWFSPFFGLAYIPILIVNLLFLVLWFFLNKKVSMYILVVLLIGFPAHRNSYALNFGGHHDEDTDAIRLLTFNIRGFTEFSSATSREHQQSVVDQIGEVQADIICLQEFSSYHNSKKAQDNYLAIKKASGLKYEYYFKVYENDKHTRSFGILILSRYPVVNTGKIRYKALSEINATIFADLDMNGKTVRLITAHLQSNQLTPQDLDMVESPDMESLNEERAKRIVGKLRTSYSLRAGQAQAIDSVKENSPYPVIICGDFNDTPVSYAYRIISGDMQDAFLQKGAGLGATFKPFPLIRIDYILLQQEVFKVLDYRRIANSGSDHYMVTASFAFR